jgi:hypothetical protein
MGTGSPGRSAGSLGEELFPLYLHGLVNVCCVEGFSHAISVKRIRAVDGAVEQETRIERLQELQDVLSILGRPLIRCDVWGLCNCLMVIRPDSSLPLLLWAWGQWLITDGEDWVSRRGVPTRRSRVGIKFIDPINHTHRVGFPKYQNSENTKYQKSKVPITIMRPNVCS